MQQTYDDRYSELIPIFGRLLAENWLQEKDLAGLDAAKIQGIRFLASRWLA